MSEHTRGLQAAVWAVAEGVATADQLAAVAADPAAALRVLEDLLADTEEQFEAVQRLTGPERDQVVADVDAELSRLEALEALWTGSSVHTEPEEPEEVRLQASWFDGHVVVWAGGRGATPAGNDELADRLEALGGPALGWSIHTGVRLAPDVVAEAVSIPIPEALGWLVAVGGGLGAEEVGASVTWLGRVAVAGVRLVAAGAVVPTLQSTRRSSGSAADAAVRWRPALADDSLVNGLARTMPGPVAVLASPANPRAVTMDVLGAVVHAIVAGAAARVEVPAPPPYVRTGADVVEAFVTRLDGSAFAAPAGSAEDIARRLERWAKPVTNSARPKLVVQLQPPDSSGAWFLSVLGPGPNRALTDVELSLGATRATAAVADELTRLERLLPVVARPGGQRRWQVYLSTEEAWDLMTVTGRALEAAGFEVRVPALSRRKPSPALRLFVEPSGDTVVGAQQLSAVRWSAVFDDVELSAADVMRLATEARPLVRSHGQWVELDRVDLKEAAAALAERAGITRLTGGEILRHAVGIDGSPLGERLDVAGSGWAIDLLEKATAAPTHPTTTPEGFVGELRSYQADALAWLGFLDSVGLGGCLALDMGLGKTPTVLAHLAGTAGTGRPTLVIAPPAVVGNWQAEAARFTPGLSVVVHHGASRASASGLAAEVDGADVIITTYGTAVRDIDALSELDWDCVVLDEAQAIKNPANETSQQLRRLSARTRLALTGTPIENGLGDLWAILDFTNPGLVGERSKFVAQLAGEREAALRALNGLLVFRRTKSEPEVAAELPDRIDELDHCSMSLEQIGLYQAVLDALVAGAASVGGEAKQGAVLAAITALKQICNHPAAYHDDGRPLEGRSGKLTRLEELVQSVFAAGERILIFTHFAEWGKRLADHLSALTGVGIACYHGGLARGARDRLVEDFQTGTGAGALVLSLKAGGTGLNLTAANHVVLYDRWWNPAVEDQARDRAWRIGQTRTVVSHRLVCPGTIDERVEGVVSGKRRIADLTLPKSSSLADLDADQLRVALGLRPAELLTDEEA
jgi:superfamily II DNA or RNA helicase